MQKVIISDTSCLILLHKLEALHILHKLFGVITITKEIQEEFQNELPEWIVVDNPTNINTRESYKLR